MQNSSSLKWFLKTALSYLGTPYKWGGDDPSGFDCSGFVLECLKTIGLCGEHDDFTAESLLKYLLTKETINRPEKGALLFYLNKQNRISHVVICLDENFQIGASGGSVVTASNKDAWEHNAYVKIRPIYFKPLKMKIIRIF